MGTFPLSVSKALELLDLLPDIPHSEQSIGISIQDIYTVCEIATASIVESQPQLFTSIIARWAWICSEYPESRAAYTAWKVLRRNLSKASENPLSISQARAYAVIMLHRLSNCPLKPDLQELIQHINLPEDTSIVHADDFLELYRGTVVKISESKQQVSTSRQYSFLLCQGEQGEYLRFCLWDDLSAQAQFCRPGCTIHILSTLRQIAVDGRDIYHSGSDSLLIIEPDILLNATDLAECFNGNKMHHAGFFFRKLAKKTSSISMLTGTVAGAYLDALFENPEPDILPIIKSVLALKPLSALQALKHKEHSIKFRDDVYKLLPRMKLLKEYIKADFISAEAGFISPVYGIAGRLDLLLEYADKPNHKDVVELKSGKAPLPEYTVYSPQPLPTGAWVNHVAQVACYGMLLDSAFKGRKGSSMLLYAQANDKPARNVPELLHWKKCILSIRNAIIATEAIIMQSKHIDILFDKEILAVLSPFQREEAWHLIEQYHALDEVSKAYTGECYAFLLREQYAARTGTARNQGFSALWLDSLENRQNAMNALGFLVMDENASDFEAMHLVLSRTHNSTPFITLRPGDIVLLYAYKQDNAQAATPAQGHLFKAVLRAINEDSVLLSIRNKQARKDLFLQKDVFWAIEPDTSVESVQEGMIRALGSFIICEIEKRNLLLGKSIPRLQQSSSIIPENMHPVQQQLLKAVLQSKDYFLVQGPPGTGKTSSLLRGIVLNLFQDPKETILLLAYTNRAVDEICETVHKAGLPFLRLGSKDSTAYPDNVLSSFAHSMKIEELSNLLQNHRIIISTVATVLTSAELFTLKKFTTTITDEAAQLLEPHLLGIWPHTGRLILIGDEKQLPAVVQQDAVHTMTDNSILKELGICDMRMSLFERLLRICKQNGWHHAYGMLTVQGRMHQDIGTYVSQAFYHNKLLTMHGWQTEQDSIELPRILWIDMPPGSIARLHEPEALLAATLAMELIKVGSTGIIAPFRAQIAAINKYISPVLRSEIMADTVERYQGSERDNIIISLAIHNSTQCSMIESVMEAEGQLIDRKLNVALTRARKRVYILGCCKAIREGSAYAHLKQYLLEKNAIFSPEDLSWIMQKIQASSII
jgi:DNA replication ATP-dependent helicase Dna2